LDSSRSIVGASVTATLLRECRTHGRDEQTDITASSNWPGLYKFAPHKPVSGTKRPTSPIAGQNVNSDFSLTPSKPLPSETDTTAVDAHSRRRNGDRKKSKELK